MKPSSAANKIVSVTFALFAVTTLLFLSSCKRDINPADVDYYTCAMHPSVKANAPGKCPFCGMNLVPVKKKTGTNMPTTEMPMEKMPGSPQTPQKQAN